MKNSVLSINNKKGILIVCEGISGSGKSESISQISGFLDGLDIGKAKIVEWNSNKTIRKIIKAMDKAGILSTWVFSLLQWLSFFIDYFTIIMPVLNKSNIVISDRYVYTALTRDLANGSGGTMSRLFCSLVRKPDLLFFFDTHHNTCYERITVRGKALFHTNKAIKQNRLLKCKDLYYLKKLRGYYVKILKEEKLLRQTNIVLVKENSSDATETIKKYIDLKLNRANFIENASVKAN